MKLDEVAGVVLGGVGFLGVRQASWSPHLDESFIVEFAFFFQASTDRLRDPVSFSMRRRDDKCRLRLSILLRFSGCGKIGVRQRLIAFSVGNLFDPPKRLKLIERLPRPPFAECLCDLFIFSLLSEDFSDLRNTQPRLFFQEFKWFTRRNTSVLPAITNQNHPRLNRFRHFEYPHHIPRAKLACLIHKNDAATRRFLHFLVLKEPGHRVRVGETCFFAQHLAARLNRLGQCNDRLPRFRQRFADLLFERRFSRSGNAANNHDPVTRAKHM